MNKSFDLAGKTAVITGAAGGIGTELVKFLAAQGASIAALDLRSVAYCAEIEADFGVRCITMPCDLTKPEEIKPVITDIAAQLGKIDILVNNAGIYAGLKMLPFYEQDGDVWDSIYNVNVKGTWQITSAVMPFMIAQKSGSVINISSSSILQGVPGLCHYVASKGAVWAMTRSMANDVGAFGVRVNSVSPGYTMTAASVSLGGTPEGIAKNNQRNIDDRSIQREMTATDVCGAVGFLACDASGFITGQNINVDGGSVHY